MNFKYLMKKYWYLFVILALVVLGVGYYLISPLFIVVEIDETSVTESGQQFDVLHEMLFQPDAHEVSGSLKVIELDGKTYLRFEDFETINGPNLHVWLSKDKSPSGDNYIDLGPLKGTKGSFEYELPEGTDLSEYRYVLVWCVPFRVLFSFVELMF